MFQHEDFAQADRIMRAQGLDPADPRVTGIAYFASKWRQAGWQSSGGEHLITRADQAAERDHHTQPKTRPPRRGGIQRRAAIDLIMKLWTTQRRGDRSKTAA
jgi:hypothetical protein